MVAPELDLSVYGMLESDMNVLTALSIDGAKTGGLPAFKNTVAVFADGVSIFYGGFKNAWGNYHAAPDVCFHVEAQTVYIERQSAYAATSLPGPQPVANIVSGICENIGLDFLNNGVVVVANNPNLPGSAIQQINKLANDYNFNVSFEGKKLTISPNGLALPYATAIVNSETGLIGWPSFDKTGTQFVSLFNPNIKFMGAVEISSSNTRANGKFVVTKLTYHLESEKPNGAWFMSCICGWWLN